MAEAPLFKAAPATSKWLVAIARIAAQMPITDCFPDPGDIAVLCDEARAVLSREATCVELTIQGTDRLVIVGDVHGQLRDLVQHVLSIQRRAFESKDADYSFLFLGDYVDRGPCGVEVLSLLLALKVTYPKLIYLLRGNHEEIQTCRTYGFLSECRAKLDVGLWNKFVGVFSDLPLAATVGVSPSKYIFCCHGGLSPQMKNISALQHITRSEYGYETLDESDVIDGLLWSDPADHIEPFRANLRGCGYTFGAAACSAFLAANEGIVFICRAHQMVMEGFQWSHEGQLLTVFSAPNYCGINNNKGAVAIVKGNSSSESKTIAMEFVTFTSVESGGFAPPPQPTGDYFS